VPARLPDESAGLFLVDLGAAGVVRETQQGTSIAPLGVLELNDVRVTAEDACLPQASGPEQLIRTAVHAAQLAQCACMLGAAQKAVELTAAYVSTREQFGRPIGTFQAVSQRAADMYIDVATLRVAVLQAAWRMAEGLPVDRELAIAGYWAAEAGHRIQAAAMHLHGGMGFDCDYELHRYYLLSRQMEMTLGGASAHLKTLGDWMAQAYSEVARDASRDKTA